MVTLLLTFFILLFAMSSINENKWKVLVEAFSGGAPTQDEIDDALSKDREDIGEIITIGPDKNSDTIPKSPEDIKDFNDLYAYLRSYVDENQLQSDIELYKGDGYTFMTFANSIFFDGDSSVLKNEGKEILDVLGEALVGIKDKIGAIQFEGHTARAGDADSQNQSMIDRQLSSDRAVNVLYYMQCKNIILPDKLTSTGHGEFKPIVPHDGTEATRIKNRRVEINICELGAERKTLDEIYKEAYGTVEQETTDNSSIPKN